MADEAATGTRSATAGTGAASRPPDQRQVGLRAGSVDDNDHWDDYMGYRKSFAALGISVHDVDVSERHVFTVTDASGRPVLGARITVTGEQGTPSVELRTYADGRAFFFPRAALDGKGAKAANANANGVGNGGASQLTATIDKDGVAKTISVDRSETSHPVRLPMTSPSGKVKLDVQFLVDATGSMGDEIAQLRENMVSIAQRVHGLGAAPDVRYALTVYRDHGDEYVTRTFDFTGDVEGFARQLRTVEAAGGGDTPEDVSEGLHDAVHKATWRGDDTVKLILLVGDAAPHLDYRGEADYAVEMLAAAKAGIKVHALAASGLDDQGEYAFRQIAEATEGQFMFLTYGADGGPGDSTTHHVEGYAPQSLDDLVVKLIGDEVQRAAKGQ